jgi:hypothetical protein
MMFEEPLGVICLGALVGFLLGIGLASSRHTLRAVLTILGAALGGAPVAFIAASEHRWLYPVGLLLGFLWVRTASLWKTISTALSSRGSSKQRISAIVAFELAFVFCLTCLAVAYIVVMPQRAFVQQSGELRMTGTGNYEVFYSEPFDSPPNLTLPPNTVQSEDLQIVDQRADGFKLHSGLGTTYGATIKWIALGRPKSQRRL